MESHPSEPVENLTEEQADSELARLAHELLEHDMRYWEEDAPTISDAEYNVLKQRNAEIEARFPHLIREDSPTLRAELDHAYWSAKTGLDRPTRADGSAPGDGDADPPEAGPEGQGGEALPPAPTPRRPRGLRVSAKGAGGLDDREIALIKAMLRRGMRNAEIQFYFNRPDRRVNSGRITEIKRQSRGADIEPASEAQLDAFLADFVASAAVPAAPPSREVPVDPPEPTEAEKVVALFRIDKSGAWRLDGNETDELECKREVNTRKLAPVVRAMAGMANNKGGIILLGVEDKSGRVIGLPGDDFEKLDPVKVTSAAQAHLQPVPSFTKGVVKLGELTVGYVKVARCPDRPVIVFSPGDRMDNGDVLFRYPAETTPIRFGELRSLLDERDARRFRELAAATQRIAEIGVGRAAILNTDDGRLDMEGGTRLVLDAALLDQINFIREGEFHETEGAPTLKVVGEVAATGGRPLGTGRRLITDEDVLRNFLDQETVLEPVEYIRFAVAGSDRSWPPIFYFARQARLAPAELAGLIEGVDTTKGIQRGEAAARAKGVRSAWARHPGSPARRLAALLAGDLSEPSDPKSAEHLAKAIEGIPDADAAPLPVLLALLKQCWVLVLEGQRPQALSHIFRAAARLDEVFFNPA